jgi:hypothetical protein
VLVGVVPVVLLADGVHPGQHVDHAHLAVLPVRAMPPPVRCGADTPEIRQEENGGGLGQVVRWLEMPGWLLS